MNTTQNVRTRPIGPVPPVRNPFAPPADPGLHLLARHGTRAPGAARLVGLSALEVR